MGRPVKWQICRICSKAFEGTTTARLDKDEPVKYAAKGLCNHCYSRDLRVRNKEAGKICSKPGCQRAVRSKGLCGAHYKQLNLANLAKERADQSWYIKLLHKLFW